MLASVRAGFAAALVALFSSTAFAADKPFQRSDLADSAVRPHLVGKTIRRVVVAKGPLVSLVVQ